MSLDSPDVMWFPIEGDENKTLVIERASFFRLERQTNGCISIGDYVHYQTPHMHRIWRLTGERDWMGSYRGVWPD